MTYESRRLEIEMELAEYILQNMVDRLLIRLDLTRLSRYGAGMEAVRASLVTCNRDEGVMLHAVFVCHAGSGMGNLDLISEVETGQFERKANGIAAYWDGQFYWSEPSEAVCVFVPTRPRTRTRQHVSRLKLDASHVLVLQHLARIMGALGSTTLTSSSADELDKVDRAVATMTGRLQAVIAEGNRKLEALGQLTSVS